MDVTECTGQAQNVFPPIDLLWKFSIAKEKNLSLFVHPHHKNYSFMQLEYIGIETFKMVFNVVLRNSYTFCLKLTELFLVCSEKKRYQLDI